MRKLLLSLILTLTSCSLTQTNKLTSHIVPNGFQIGTSGEELTLFMAPHCGVSKYQVLRILKIIEQDQGKNFKVRLKIIPITLTRTEAEFQENSILFCAAEQGVAVQILPEIFDKEKVKTLQETDYASLSQVLGDFGQFKQCLSSGRGLEMAHRAEEYGDLRKVSVVPVLYGGDGGMIEFKEELLKGFLNG